MGSKWKIVCSAIFLCYALLGCGSDTVPTEPNEPLICVTGLPCVREAGEVIGGLTFSTISAGGEHTCALAIDGAAYCWGSNRNGQLGDGSTAQYSSTPVQVAGGRTYSKISAGALHTCAITVVGAAYCWGNGDNGALGSGLLQDICGTVECSRVPVQVIGGYTFAAIDAGFNHTCAVNSLSFAYCWGANGHGELGTGAYFSGSSIPEPVEGSHQFTLISAGSRYSCGLAFNGAIWCWGSDATDALGAVAPDVCPSGQSGDRCSAVPLIVEAGVSFLQVSAGDQHACAISQNLRAYCWGENSAGQIGTSSSGGGRVASPIAVTVPGSTQLSQVTAADTHTCAVTASSAAFCWGSNRSGQLGIGTDAEMSGLPVRVVGDLIFGSVTAGGNSLTGHACGITGERRVYCWGARDLGQVGDGK